MNRLGMIMDELDFWMLSIELLNSLFSPILGLESPSASELDADAAAGADEDFGPRFEMILCSAVWADAPFFDEIARAHCSDHDAAQCFFPPSKW
jgi:hypothetical protein